MEITDSGKHARANAIFAPLRRALLGALPLLGIGVVHAGGAPYSPGWKFHQHSVHIDVQADGSSTVRREYVYTVLARSQLKSMSEQTISYHEGDGTLEDIVAYTLKADGTHVPVPETNIQVTSHNGINGALPAFSDYKDRNIIFPNVEVGDSLVFSYTIRNQKPTFAHHYSLLTYFSRDDLYDHAELVVNAPLSMGLKQKTYNLDAPVVTQVGKGREQWKWTYVNLHATDPSKETALYQRVWRYEDWPTVEISNFRDYAQIADAYARQATHKAQVSERIRKLSQRIVKGASGKRQRAERIYRWVAKNISFAGNCLAGGDVVPRDTDLILNMKMGDCKDHSTLVQSLLDAQGIASTQVLINTGSWYALPEVPCWQAFNHVIDYLPDFDLYADATSSSSPFGTLPVQDRGKPVLLAARRPRVGHTPMPGYDANWSTTNSRVQVRDDGSLKVASHYRVGGPLANSLSERFAQWRESPAFDGGADYFRRFLSDQGYKGAGGFDDLPSANDPSDTFAFGMHYRVDDYLDTSNPYGVTLSTLFPSPDPIARLAAYAAVDHYDHEFLCQGDEKTEQLTFEFPDNVKLLAVPRDVHVHTAQVRYDATYERQGNSLRIKRTVVDTTPGPTCAAQVVAQYARVAAAIKRDLRAQAVYEPR